MLLEVVIVVEAVVGQSIDSSAGFIAVLAATMVTLQGTVTPQ
jgi:hypothetical protein